MSNSLRCLQIDPIQSLVKIRQNCMVWVGTATLVAGLAAPSSADVLQVEVGDHLEITITTMFLDSPDSYNFGSVDIYSHSVISNDGTFLNAGFLRAEGSFLNGDRLINDGALSITGVLVNFGTFDNNSGALEVGQGIVTGHLAELQNVGTLNNYGRYHNRGRIDNSGILNNYGILLDEDTSLHANSGTLNNYGEIFLDARFGSVISGVVVNDGLIEGQLHDTSTWFDGVEPVGGTLTFDGDLSGAGTINAGLVEISGTLNAGNSAGLMTFGSDVTWMTGSAIIMELGGYDRGTTYDSFNINGNLVFETGVTLDVLPFDIFDPVFGDWFDLAYVMGDIAGSFDVLPANWLISTVDLSDGPDGYLHALRLTYNGLEDLASVPEPGTLVLVGMGLFGVGWTRRRKSRAWPCCNCK